MLQGLDCIYPLVESEARRLASSRRFCLDQRPEDGDYRYDAGRLAALRGAGTVWVWNEGAAERISGTAEDFALVVTQRRNVADTGLVVEGEGARAWMAIAQCFAGAPEQMPAPGERLVVYGEDQTTPFA